MNYQKELEALLAKWKPQEKPPRLLLHSCCAPCSSYVLEYLSSYFEITVYYDNSNIYPEAEYSKRLIEQQELIKKMKVQNPISFIAGEYNHQEFLNAIQGKEQIPEGGERCVSCFEMRLKHTAQLAKSGDYDYFTTTLTISPLKNAEKLNEIGKRLGEEMGVTFLPSDFKKKNGYKRSIELSQKYGLYRQDYCGCEFSQKERKESKKAK